MVTPEASGADAVFVYWRDASARSGRVVGLDSENRIKTLVYCAVPLKTYPIDECPVLIPRTGGIMIQSWGIKTRPLMPRFALEARALHAIKRYNGPFNEQSLPVQYLAADPCLTPPFCIACRVCARSHSPRLEVVRNYNAYWVCRRCRTVWHEECSKSSAFLTLRDDAPLCPDGMGTHCPFCVRL